LVTLKQRVAATLRSAESSSASPIALGIEAKLRVKFLRDRRESLRFPAGDDAPFHDRSRGNRIMLGDFFSVLRRHGAKPYKAAFCGRGGVRLPRSLNQRIPMRSTKLTELASMITRSACSQPYTTQSAIPIARIKNIFSDKSPADPVSQHFLSCGK
jgi:hypothetical protein